MQLELKDKIAVISGGSIGIGLAVAKGLAAEGVHLALCARNDERLQKEANAIRDEFDVNVYAKSCDVSKATDIEEFLQSIESEFGGADILINNAGTGSNEKIISAADEDWQYYWDLHVMAAVRLSRGLMPMMEKRGGGVILNNSSICAKQPLGYEPIYNTTKAALSMFSKCLANECIPLKIRVNTINPGLIMTPDWRNTAAKAGPEQGLSTDEYLDNIAKENTPIGRFATPEGGWLKTV